MSSARGRRFGKTLVVFFLGTVLSKLTSLLLLPLYTRLLSPDEYGTYDLWFTVCVFFAPIAFCQAWDALYRFYFDASSPQAAVTNALAIMVAGAILYSASMSIALVLTRPGDEVWIYLFGLSVAVQYFAGFLARAKLRNTLFVVSGLTNTVVSSGLTVALLLMTDIGVTALFVGLSLGNVLQAVAIAWRLRMDQYVDRRTLEWHTVRAMLRFSIPLALASVAYWLLSGYTRLAITVIEGPAANGLYAVADRFAVGIAMTSTVIMYAWQEFLYTASPQGDQGGSSTSRLFRAISAASLLAAAATISLTHLFFADIVGPTYATAYTLVPFTVLAATANTLAGAVGSMYMAQFRTSWLLWTTIMAAGINMVLGVYFTRVWGAHGAGAALLISMCVLAMVRLHSLRGPSFRSSDRHVLLAFALVLLASTSMLLDLPLLAAALVASTVLATGMLIHDLRVPREKRI